MGYAGCRARVIMYKKVGGLDLAGVERLGWLLGASVLSLAHDSRVSTPRTLARSPHCLMLRLGPPNAETSLALELELVLELKEICRNKAVLDSWRSLCPCEMLSNAAHVT